MFTTHMRPGVSKKVGKTLICCGSSKSTRHKTSTSHMKKVLLFNPRSALSKPRIPNSVLTIAAALEGLFDYVIVDGNRESALIAVIWIYLGAGKFCYVVITSMPGPQLNQAIPVSKAIREQYPEIIIVWGGYFASNHP